MALTRLIFVFSLLLSMKGYSAISEQELDRVIARFQNVYANDFLEQTYKDFVFKKDFRKGAVRAYIEQKSLFYLITLEKGLITNREMTSDGVALIICHELGHALGGIPYKKKKTIDEWGETIVDINWASAEGQADYFATSTCMKKYLDGEFNQETLAAQKIPSVINSKCNNAFSSTEERAICKRTALAIKPVMAAINNDKVSLSLSTPDRSERETTALGYPELQCRMDTYFQGALSGSRPRCWYKPGHRGNPIWSF